MKEMNMLSLIKLKTIFTTILLGSSVLANTRVALVTNSNEGNATVDLAIVELSKEPDIVVLERSNIDKLLGEQKLSLAGYVTAETAVKAGNVLNADLLAVVTVADKKAKPGMIVFDATTGVRYQDSALEGKTPEAKVGSACSGVMTSVQKRVAIQKQDFQLVSILSTRNVDLGREQEGYCQALGRAVERVLVAQPKVAVLERTWLNKVIDERGLSMSAESKNLLPSMRLLDLTFRAGKDDSVICAVIDSRANKELVTVERNGSDNSVFPSRIVAALLSKLGLEQSSTKKVNLAEEAKRFYTESKFRYGHRQFAMALTAAEAAYALQPASQKYLEHLTHYLFNYAEWLLGYHNTSGAITVRTDPDTMMHSLRVANRAFDCAVSMLKARKPSRRGMEWYSWNDCHTYIEKPLKTVVGHNDETLAELKKFRLRFGKVLKETYDKNYAEREKNLDTYYHRAWSRYLPHLMWDVCLTTKEYVDEVLRVLEHGIQTAVERPTPAQRQKYLKEVTHTVTFGLTFDHKFSDEQKKAVEQALLKHAESDDVAVRVYSRFWAHAWRSELKETTAESYLESSTRFVNETRRELEKLKDAPFRKREICYRLMSEALMIRTKNGEVTQKNNELARSIAQMMIDNGEACSSALSYSFFVRMSNIKEKDDALVMVRQMEDAIALLKSAPRDKISDNLHSNKHTLKELDKWRLKLISKHKLPIDDGRPWVSEKVLLSVETDKRLDRVVKPILKGNTLYAVALSWDKRKLCGFAQILTVTLPDGKPELGEKIEIKWNPSYSWNKDITYSWLSDTHLLFGTPTQGLFGLPLGDGAVIRLTKDDGLPSNYIQSVGIIGGRMYLGLGEPEKEGYLASVDVNTKEVTIIASSFRKPAESPFDNVGRPVHFSYMLPDPKRDTLLVYVRFGLHSKPTCKGLWSIDRKGTLNQIHNLHCYGEWMAFHNEDTLHIGDSWQSMAVNLKTGETSLLISRTKGRKRVTPGVRKAAVYASRFTHPPFIVTDRFLWSSNPWGRARPGKDLETLALPYAASKGHLPHDMLALTPDKRFIVWVDEYHIILLQLAKDNLRGLNE